MKPAATEPKQAPEGHLARALAAVSPAERERHARAGLTEAEVSPDTQLLLLRQLYLSLLEQGQLLAAAAMARRMAAVGELEDVAHQDAARALFAAGRVGEAIAEQRLGVRAAPARRRSFHLWCLATFLQFAGDLEGSARTLLRAERWASRGGPLLRAHGALVQLEMGRVPEDLARARADLSESPSREGYGQYILGMIGHEMGDRARATMHLSAFMRRNASADVAKQLTLCEELRRAQAVLARVASD